MRTRLALFTDSYHLESMTRVELQRATLLPSAWRNLIAQTSISPLTNVVIKSPRLVHRQSCLVPGGRFLLASHTAVGAIEQRHLVLWDLGIPGTSWRMNPTVVAELKLEERQLESFKFFLGEEGKEGTLRIGILDQTTAG